jgi:hypothetical protein
MWHYVTGWTRANPLSHTMCTGATPSPIEPVQLKSIRFEFFLAVFISQKLIKNTKINKKILHSTRAFGMEFSESPGPAQ